METPQYSLISKTVSKIGVRYIPPLHTGQKAYPYILIYINVAFCTLRLRILEYDPTTENKITKMSSDSWLPGLLQCKNPENHEMHLHRQKNIKTCKKQNILRQSNYFIVTLHNPF